MNFIITSILLINSIMYAIYAMETDDEDEQLGAILMFMLYIYMAFYMMIDTM